MTLRNIFIIFLATFIFLIGCGKKEPDVIKIGAILPLTGESAQYGKACREGIELAIEKMNTGSGIKGRKVNIVYEDDQGLPQYGVAAIQKLVDQDHVKVIIGPLFSSVTLAVAPIAEKNKIVVLSPGSSSPKITGAGDYIFRNEISDEYGANESAKLYFGLGFDQIAILYVNNDYGNGVRDVTSDTFQELDGKVLLSEAFQQNATDFRAQLTKIASTKPKAILIIGYKEQIQILKQIKELGLSQQILGTPLLEDAEVIKEAGDAADGAVYSYYGSYDQFGSDSISQNFIKEFQNKWGEKPSYYGPIAYDATMIIYKAIEKGGINPDSIKSALYQTSNFQGISGNTTFDQNGDVMKPVILKKIKNSMFIRYTQ